MVRQKLYQRVVHPFIVLALAATALFFLYGANKLLGSPGMPEPLAPKGQDVFMHRITPVEREPMLAGEIDLDRSKNPFTAGHEDWVVAENATESAASTGGEPRLEVRGIVQIKSRVKALVVDLDEKDGKSFWIKPGDLFRGYTVAYISKENIVLTGKEKNLRFSLKKQGGKLYSGRGEIFVAPDIDLYLKRLRAREGDAAAEPAPGAATEGDSAVAASDTAGDAGETVQGTAGGLSAGGGGISPGNDGGGAGPGGGDGSQGAKGGSSHDEEMAFIRELMKIFREGNNGGN